MLHTTRPDASAMLCKAVKMFESSRPATSHVQIPLLRLKPCEVQVFFSHFSSSSPSSSNIVQSPTLQSMTTKDVFEEVVRARKSWKLQGDEVLWPPELEAALLEGASESYPHLSDPSDIIRVLGLDNYQPDDSRETRLLGRFPMRNRFISDYIYQKTGKRRTAKQVGNRLQHLSDASTVNDSIQLDDS
ncbi:hypothetical protein DL96DRAFT_1710473 [Flagelloscypha sp. PMI_526]|nr:hypothetical protein DL96DRAFT_1710473 [Flagelloscypha sp. PMI_526]